MHQQIKTWHDDDNYCNDDEIIEWYEGYKKRKAQKAKIKEVLLPLAWHPSRYWDCVCQKMKKGMQKHYGSKHRLFFVSGDRIQKVFLV